MMDKIYEVTIKYTDIMENNLSERYEIKANYDKNAEQLAMEVFLIEHGVFRDVNISVKPLKVSLNDLNCVDDVKRKVESMNSLFKDFSYDDFVKAYKKYGGYNARLSNKQDSFFWFDIFNLSIEAIYLHSSCECYINTNELYFENNNNKKILALNNWREFFYV